MSYYFLQVNLSFSYQEIANTRNAHIWETENPRAILEHEIEIEKVAIHSEGVLDPYYFDNETVIKQDYCQFLDTYVRQESQNFHRNALF